MESKDLLYCAITAVLGIISAAMGFAGEVTRVKVTEIYIVDDTCVYPSSPALALGIVAAVFAIIARIYISVSFGGSGCCRSGPNSTPISKLFFVLSWVASVGAVLLLLAAAGLNHREGGEIDSYGYITCYVPKPGIFAAGAVLALLSAGLGIVAYIVILSSTAQRTTHPSIGLPAAHANVDVEKYPQQYTPQQYTHQQYPPQQYTHQQYPPQQYPPQQYPTHQ
ncbi:uncharacterized protein LOC112522129 [Cynara cardunculus var. scolymus]|uniref:Uncharacterized protein n=1 Tax=Cynara cardunculus var. scolymus TaxID=59895 RepID=A0A118JTB9_CYNCS|nr:uncharacterized protein LOC112522129 [Cynara cardunculus var. scolymus]KVH90041.1 Protein of unknown function DUF1218 [Cynara cardunculus var. scolymus]